MKELHIPFDTDIITAVVSYDENDVFTYYISLKEEILDWCNEALSTPVSLIVDLSEKSPGYCVVLACDNDLIHFKLRWT